ncbi:MAG: hypothetical protein WBZ42_04200 [Halobacteriota archaeon]
MILREAGSKLTSLLDVPLLASEKQTSKPIDRKAESPLAPYKESVPEGAVKDSYGYANQYLYTWQFTLIDILYIDVGTECDEFLFQLFHFLFLQRYTHRHLRNGATYALC